MSNACAYNITVRRAVFDGDLLFEARVRELPDVAEYGDSYDEAYSLAVDAIETTADHFAQAGRAMPSPYVPADDFSGRVTLRVPRSLHRAIAEAAEDEGVSLNQHIVNVLGYFCGYANAERTDATATWRPATVSRPASSPTHLRLVRSSDLQVKGQAQAAA